MAQPQIEELFDNSRWPGGIHLVLAGAYFPFGIVLALLRAFIGVHAFLISCLLPKLTVVRSVILRVMCAVLGIVVNKSEESLRDSKVKVMVANYTSTLDHLAVDLVYPSILPCVWDLPPTLMWLLGYVEMGAKQGRQKLIENAQTHCRESNVPLLVFPEGASTNGKRGLLKFSAWPFSLDHPVQPVLIKVKRPIVARLSPSILGGRWWRDIFWTLFVPYTSFNIRLLPPISKKESESLDDFAKRVQVTMAMELGLRATTHTTVDKVEYTKRKFFLQKALQRADSVPGEGGDPDGSLMLMVRQVKEVLPHVSDQTIQRDLALTKDVDLTITNILEGRVEVGGGGDTDQGESPPSSAGSSTSSTQKSMPAKSSTAAPSFPRSPQLRQMSFEERKQALLSYARQKYLSKHGQHG